MKKTSKKDKINLLFSAFLVISFVICGYFFSSLAQTLTTPWNDIIGIIIFVLFGLVLFYATRVGEGKQIYRLSISSLLLVVLPSLYIILASVVSSLPFYEQISANTTIVMLAGVALGYGLPFSFISGFELDNADAEEKIVEPDVEAENSDISEEIKEECEEDNTGEENIEEDSVQTNDELENDVEKTDEE